MSQLVDPNCSAWAARPPFVRPIHVLERRQYRRANSLFFSCVGRPFPPGDALRVLRDGDRDPAVGLGGWHGRSISCRHFSYGGTSCGSTAFSTRHWTVALPRGRPRDHTAAAPAAARRTWRRRAPGGGRHAGRGGPRRRTRSGAAMEPRRLGPLEPGAPAVLPAPARARTAKGGGRRPPLLPYVHARVGGLPRDGNGATSGGRRRAVAVREDVWNGDFGPHRPDRYARTVITSASLSFAGGRSLAGGAPARSPQLRPDAEGSRPEASSSSASRGLRVGTERIHIGVTFPVATCIACHGPSSGHVQHYQV